MGFVIFIACALALVYLGALLIDGDNPKPIEEDDEFWGGGI